MKQIASFEEVLLDLVSLGEYKEMGSNGRVYTKIILRCGNNEEQKLENPVSGLSGKGCKGSTQAGTATVQTCRNVHRVEENTEEVFDKDNYYKKKYTDCKLLGQKLLPMNAKR